MSADLALAFATNISAMAGTVLGLAVVRLVAVVFADIARGDYDE